MHHAPNTASPSRFEDVPQAFQIDQKRLRVVCGVVPPDSRMYNALLAFESAVHGPEVRNISMDHLPAGPFAVHILPPLPGPRILVEGTHLVSAGEVG